MKKIQMFQTWFDKQRINKIFSIFSYILLTFITFKQIHLLKIPYVVPDEFGYWSAASYFSGYDWSSASNLNPYYAFGYGMILALILKVFHGVYAYKASIAFNAVILCGLFAVLKKICDKMWRKSLWNSIVSLGVCLYTFNIVYSQLALCELLLEFVFFTSIFFLLEILDHASWISCVGYTVSLSLLYWIHMRSLGILAAGGICLLLLYKEHKITTYKLCISIAIIIIMCFLSVVIKNNMTQFLYGESALASINDYAGQADKLLSLKALNGVIDFFTEMVGQLWYLGSASFLLLFFALAYLMRDIAIQFIQKRIGKEYGLYELYLLLSFFMTLGISVIGTMQSRRTDALIYGRYVEFTILPVLVFGIFSIMNQKIKIKTIFLIAVLYLLMSVFVDYTYQTRTYSGMVYTTVTGLYKFLWEHYDSFVFQCTLFTIIVVTLFIIFCYGKKELYNTIPAVVLVCIIWLAHANGFINNGVIVHQRTVKVDEIANVIEEGEYGYPVYYVYDSEDSLLVINRVFMLQFLLKDIKIQCIYVDDINRIEENEYYVIVNQSSKCTEKIEERYFKITEGNPLVLYRNHT